MTATLALIRRYPIKSIGGEAVDEASVRPSSRLPGDRIWALLTENGERHVGPVPDKWLPKSCFMCGAVASQLQAITGGAGTVDGEGAITLQHPAVGEISFDPAHEGQKLLDWVAPLWPSERPAPTRLVRAPVSFTDEKAPWVSILSLSSLAALERDLGMNLGILRWRGNLWVDGWPAQHERDLIGQVIRIGEIEVLVTEPIGRCTATNANTETGEPDIDMPAALKRLYGHSDFGVFGQIVTGGTLRTGDRIET